MTDKGALARQQATWDGMSDVYAREIEQRFAPIVQSVVELARLRPGERVIDVGTGTGAVAIAARERVGAAGAVVAIDISEKMLAIAKARAASFGADGIEFHEAGAEALPGEGARFDVVLASLSLMFVPDRAAAAREAARVLRPGGRFVASVWAGADTCDIVRFQQAAAWFAGPQGVSVGPGALADPAPLVAALAASGIEAAVETKVIDFAFDSFDSAWETFARVTTAGLAPEREEEARSAVRALMWPHGDGPRVFHNATHFIVGRKER